MDYRPKMEIEIERLQVELKGMQAMHGASLDRIAALEAEAEGVRNAALVEASERLLEVNTQHNRRVMSEENEYDEKSKAHAGGFAAGLTSAATLVDALRRTAPEGAQTDEPLDVEDDPEFVRMVKSFDAEAERLELEERQRELDARRYDTD